MPRFKLTIEYDGRPFYGWQTQSDGSGIQDYVEKSLFELFQKKQTIKTFCSGRTDRGVHAIAQIIHCDIETDMEAGKLREALNYYLKPNPISILHLEITNNEFHARFDAIQRQYRYKILNRRAMPTFRDGLILHVPGKLDLNIMKKSAEDFIGTHDFTTFRSVECQSPSAIRTIDNVFFEMVNDEIHFCVHARSFLHHQIRSMVGSLVKIGLGKYHENFVKEAIKAKDRTKCGPVASPYGLYFEKTIY